MTDAASVPDASASDPSADRLHQPVRVVVAVVELALAAVAAWGAVRCWDSAVRTLTVHTGDGAALVSRIYEGDLVGVAFALAAVAALLVVDACRQSMLGVRTRRRRRGSAASR